MENEIENVIENNLLEVTENPSENNEEQNVSADEESNENGGLDIADNDNSGDIVYTTEVALVDTQYDNIVANLNLLNNLSVILVMFTFTIFIYLFLHFTLERRKY